MNETLTNNNVLPYAIINGIRRYGETSPVTEIDVRKFRRTPESYLHIIRHMRALSPAAEQLALSYTIIDQGETKLVTKELLTRLLTTTGSKFNKLLTDPTAIISFAEEHVQEQVKKRERLLWQKTPRGDYFCYLAAYMTTLEKSFFHLAPEEPFGSCNVVAITEDMRSHLTERMRGTGEKDDHILTYTIEDVPPPSNTLIIILYKPNIETPANVCTAYTGIIAPPLPKHTQTPEEFLYNKQWWEKYTFIV